jgi:hypothetical protein
VFLDLSRLKEPYEGGKPTMPNWRIMVDEITYKKFSIFASTKDGIVEPTCQQLGHLRNKGTLIKFWRMDNAGENKKLAARTYSTEW